MMKKLKQTIEGCCRVELTGAFPESVLNLCAMHGIEIWALECVDAYTLRFFAYEKYVDELAQLAKKSMCEMKRLDTFGGSRFRAFMKNHIWVFVGAILALTALAVSTLFIWDIDVYGCEGISEGEVLRALAECGVDCGSYWPAISTDLVRAEMLSKLPELAWMTVNVSSSRAVVPIVERTEKPEIYAESLGADIVAAHTGIIKRLSVENGSPAVGVGYAVTEGEVLISGGMESLNRDMRYVRAQGDVIADTWHELTAVCPASGEKKTSSGVPRMRFAVKFGKIRFNFYFSSGNTVDGCDKIIHNYKLGVEGLFALPVTLIIEETIPYKTQTAPLADSDAMGKALLQTLRDGIRGEILSASLSSAESNGLCIVTLRAACEENIARLEEY